jgi:putative DNA primase/helicase
MIPFQEQIPPEEQNPHLADDLIAAELPGILNWCIEGLRKYQESGLPLPSAVKAATDDYRENQDILHEFISSLCVKQNQVDGDGIVTADVTESARALYNAYSALCQLNREKPMSARKFGLEMNDRGYKRVHTNKGNVYRGIRLVSNWIEQVYPDGK